MPYGAAASDTARFVTPGCTRARPRRGSTSRICVEPRQHEQQSARDRQRAARESGARAACDHWHRMPMTGTDDLLDLLDARRQRDQVGRVTVGGERVAFVGDAGFGTGEQARSEHRAEFAQQSCVNGHWAAASARRRPCRSASTSAPRCANRPLVTTPGIWLIARSRPTGSTMSRPRTSRMSQPLSVTVPWRQTGWPPSRTSSRAT